MTCLPRPCLRFIVDWQSVDISFDRYIFPLQKGKSRGYEPDQGERRTFRLLQEEAALAAADATPYVNAHPHESLHWGLTGTGPGVRISPCLKYPHPKHFRGSRRDGRKNFGGPPRSGMTDQNLALPSDYQGYPLPVSFARHKVFKFRPSVNAQSVFDLIPWGDTVSLVRPPVYSKEGEACRRRGSVSGRRGSVSGRRGFIATGRP